MTASYTHRRETLRAAMCNAGFNALLISSAPTRFYFSGFELHDPQPNESAGHLILTEEGTDWLCTDARYLDAARRIWDPDHIFIYSANAPEEIAKAFSEKLHGVLGFEARTLTVDFWEHFCQHLRCLELRRADSLVTRPRQCKDSDEIARIRRSCALNQRMMEWIPDMLDQGLTEMELAWEIEKYFREHGASELAFASIVAYGSNAALPHAIPSPEVRIAAEGPILIDAGCRMGDYCSDQTRTFWAGSHPSEKFLQTLHLVQEAQQKAIDAMRPGVRACDVFSVVWDYFTQHGVEAAFTHGLGHGIGLETHEGISLNRRNTQCLEPGMVITVEPGLYYPEWGGVRWEHMVLLTEYGVEIL